MLATPECLTACQEWYRLRAKRAWDEVGAKEARRNNMIAYIGCLFCICI